jgi:hypothetical protein
VNVEGIVGCVLIEAVMVLRLSTNTVRRSCSTHGATMLQGSPLRAREAVGLQEPSLVFINKSTRIDLSDGRWGMLRKQRCGLQ